MVVLIIHQSRMFTVKHESEAPVAVYRNCELPGKFAAEDMQPPSRQIHVVGFSRNIQSRQLPTEFGRMVRLNSGPAAGFEKRLQPLVPEGFDHLNSV